MAWLLTQVDGVQFVLFAGKIHQCPYSKWLHNKNLHVQKLQQISKQQTTRERRADNE